MGFRNRTLRSCVVLTELRKGGQSRRPSVAAPLRLLSTYLFCSLAQHRKDQKAPRQRLRLSLCSELFSQMFSKVLKAVVFMLSLWSGWYISRHLFFFNHFPHRITGFSTGLQHCSAVIRFQQWHSQECEARVAALGYLPSFVLAFKCFNFKS